MKIRGFLSAWLQLVVVGVVPLLVQSSQSTVKPIAVSAFTTTGRPLLIASVCRKPVVPVYTMSRLPSPWANAAFGKAQAATTTKSAVKNATRRHGHVENGPSNHPILLPSRGPYLSPRNAC